MVFHGVGTPTVCDCRTRSRFANRETGGVQAEDFFEDGGGKREVVQEVRFRGDGLDGGFGRGAKDLAVFITYSGED
jgi:hypothetical protein